MHEYQCRITSVFFFWSAHVFASLASNLSKEGCVEKSTVRNNIAVCKKDDVNLSHLRCAVVEAHRPLAVAEIIAELTLVPCVTEWWLVVVVVKVSVRDFFVCLFVCVC
jgi:hypothetical protein